MCVSLSEILLGFFVIDCTFSAHRLTLQEAGLPL